MVWLKPEETPQVPSRLLTCKGCRERVEVIELPYKHLDPDTYECGPCAIARQTREKREAA